MVTKKKKVAGRGKANEARWIRAVTFYIDGGCADGSQQACMLEAGFTATMSRKGSAKLKKHPVYLKWVKKQTRKNFITKEYLEEKLYNIIEENGRDRVTAIGKAMEMFGFIAPKKLELAGDPDKPIRFTFGTENLKPSIHDSKNRIKGVLN